MNCTIKLRFALGVVGVAAAVLGLLERAPRIDAQTLGSPTYTAEQATQGQAAYAESCASCHGANLDDGPFAGPVKGSVFRQQWGSKTVEELFTYVQYPDAANEPGVAGR